MLYQLHAITSLNTDVYLMQAIRYQFQFLDSYLLSN